MFFDLIQMIQIDKGRFKSFNSKLLFEPKLNQKEGYT